MKIRRLQNSDGDVLEQFLCKHAETSMFIRSNMNRVGLEYRDRDFHGDYFGAFDDAGRAVGVLAHYWNGNIMMQAQETTILLELAQTFQSHVNRPIAGVLGDEAQAAIIMDELSLTDEVCSINVADGLYSLELADLCMPTHRDFDKVSMVTAGEVDRGTIVRWIKDFEIEALGKVDSDELTTHVENRTNHIMTGEDHWILLRDSEPVSLSGFNARLPDMVQIAPVWTPPEHRNRGYARTLVAMTLQKAKQCGVKKSILFTDNPAAAKAYEAVGFQQIGLFRLALLNNPVDFRKRSVS